MTAPNVQPNPDLRPAAIDQCERRGPFDVIGDVHGCLKELCTLLETLGYEITPDLSVTPPARRTLVFVGDLVDRGPDTPGVLRLARGMVADGTALCVMGNHDDKLRRALLGRRVTVNNGLDRSLEQLEREPQRTRKQALRFLQSLPTHHLLDGGRLVIAHAGLEEDLFGKAGERVRSFALYGKTTGLTDEFGLPERLDWAADYRGEALVVYGHTPVREPRWVNDTVNIDTGCVFGGRLSALRYPERDVVSVPAREQYSEPRRPLR